MGSRFSSIQKSSNMILLRPALALLPFLFSCGFSAHISSTTTTTPCPLGLQSAPTGSPRSRRSSSVSVSTWNKVVNGRNQTIRVEVRDGIETKEVTEDGKLISKTVNGRNVLSSTTESGWLNPCSLKLDCPEGHSSQTVNGECQCVPTGLPTGMRKKRSPGHVWLSPCSHGLWCPRGSSRVQSRRGLSMPTNWITTVTTVIFCGLQFDCGLWWWPLCTLLRRVHPGEGVGAVQWRMFLDRRTGQHRLVQV